MAKLDAELKSPTVEPNYRTATAEDKELGFDQEFLDNTAEREAEVRQQRQIEQRNFSVGRKAAAAVENDPQCFTVEQRANAGLVRGRKLTPTLARVRAAVSYVSPSV